MRTESHDLRRILLCPQYEVKAPMPSACFRNICKQMAKMHEAIYELLPEEQTQVRSFCFLYSFCVCDSLLIRDLRVVYPYTDAVSEDQCQFQNASEEAAGSVWSY